MLGSTLALSRAACTPLPRLAAAQAQPQLQLQLAVRLLTTAPGGAGAGGKGKGKKPLGKKPLGKKFEGEEDADATAIPPEVQFLSKELDAEYDADEFVADEVVPGDEDELEDVDDELDDPALTPEEWAARFEREVAEWDGDEDEEGELAAGEQGEIEDDRLYIEMPGYDASLSMAENGMLSGEGGGADPFADWKQGTAVAPEMMNWMLPADKRRAFAKGADKPWKYFVKANHPDIVELALDVELLRLFISPTGRIRPRRFTGLTAKQQRKLARAVKISRQLALLPYLSRYPEPSPEQWKAMEEEDIAKLQAMMESSDYVEEDEDDDELDEDFEYD